MKNKFQYILLITSIILFITGCKTKQHTISENDKSNVDNIIESTIKAQPNFESMNISKMSMSLKFGERAFHFKASLRVITDSLIVLGIQPALGIELFRIEFNPTQFVIYDKMNRLYSENNYEYIKLTTRIDATFNNIQSICSHQLFSVGNKSNDYIKRSYTISPNTYSDTTTIIGTKIIQSARQLFDISNLNHRITQTAAICDTTILHSITYGELRTSNQIEFPNTIYVTTKIKNTPIKVDMQIDKINFNREFSISPINTARYKKTTITKLLNF